MIKSLKIISHLLVGVFLGGAIVLNTRGLLNYYHGTIAINLLDSSLCYGSFWAMFYLSYYLFIPQYIIKKKIVKFFLLGLLLIVGFTVYFNYTALFFRRVLHFQFHVFVKGWWFGIAGYGILLLTIGSLLRMFLVWVEESQSKLESEKQNAKHELIHLKSQLNPHFLFNTLNNIDSLIQEDACKASFALNKLSDLMRYMVYDAEKDVVSLNDEIAYLTNYLELQKLRILNPAFIQFQLEGDYSSKVIAPMMFIPFIENAFKHSSLKSASGIQIKLLFRDDKLIFKCRNAKGMIVKEKTSGIGLGNVRRRLDLLYKNNYKLDILDSNTDFCVNLELKLT